MTEPSTLRERLLLLADLARRLPPPDRLYPERFHEAREELARELRRLARTLPSAREHPR